MNGWIKKHRKIMNHWLYEDDRVFSRYEAFDYLLMNANHQDKKVMIDGQLITVERGSMITSIRKLCERWKWSNTKVVQFLDALEQDGMIGKKSDTKKTVINIVNYCKYQGSDDEENDTETTEKRHENDTETIQKHTNKNDKNVENVYIKDIYAFWNESNIIRHRELTKKMSSAINARLKKSSCDEIKQAISNYSTIIKSDLYWYTHKFTLHRFMDESILTQFMSENNPFENYRKRKGGSNGGTYGRNDAGSEEANRRDADKDADLYFGSPAS